LRPLTMNLTLTPAAFTTTNNNKNNKSNLHESDFHTHDDRTTTHTITDHKPSQQYPCLYGIVQVRSRTTNRFGTNIAIRATRTSTGGNSKINKEG
jgi:hypothetical protein